MATRTALDDRSRKPAEWQRAAAEFFGAFLLTAVAAGADIVDHISKGGIGHVARYTAPALLVMAMIWSVSAISGAHLNPVVTLAFIARRSFPAFRLAGYLAAQFAGAIAAAYVLRALFGAAVEHGITKPGPAFSDVQALASEILLTFILVFVILATAEEQAVVGKNAALAVGGTIALCGLAFSPISGGSMNPARSIGPMVAAGQFDYVWLYLLGPCLGALLAAGCAWLLLGAPTQHSLEAAHGKHQ